MADDYIYLSQDGFEKLVAELKELKTVKRPQVVADIKRARELGDLSEDAEYHAAKEAQTHIERKIAELEFKLSCAQVVREMEEGDGTITLLSTVRVRDLEDGEEIVYHLVSAPEADVMADKISIESPVGKAMIGREVGDRVKVQTPGGDVTYEILSIKSQLDDS